MDGNDNPGEPRAMCTMQPDDDEAEPDAAAEAGTHDSAPPPESGLAAPGDNSGSHGSSTLTDPPGPACSDADIASCSSSRCPHGSPTAREDGTSFTPCPLCQEARDAVPSRLALISQCRSPKTRRTATVGPPTGPGVLNFPAQRPGDFGGGGSTEGRGLPKSKSHGGSSASPGGTDVSMTDLSLRKSYSCQETSSLMYAGSSSAGIAGGQDLRRTQSLKSLFCMPGHLTLSAHDQRLAQAQQCPRLSGRRNALNDPFKMPMPQEVRERVQREARERKTNFLIRVSRYFQALFDDDPEVDLI